MSLIPMVNLTSQWNDIQSDVHKSINSVAESGNWILGSHVENFEKNLALCWQRNFAVGCASGLDAIEIGLRALGLKKGEKVITTPLTAFATTLAIVRAGGVPVYIDVDDSGLINLSLVVKYLNSNPTVRFIVPVHLYGHCIDLDTLQEIKDKYDLLIVEDCAQSIAASSNGKLSGSVGQIASTSFYPTKNLGALGDGGAILTNNISLMSYCKMIRDYGQSKKYHHDIFGMNSRLDEIQAAVLDFAILPKLNAWNNVRKKIAERYLSEIHNPFIKILVVPKNSKSSWHLFPIIISESRDLFQKYMGDSMIATGIYYPILCNDQKVSKTFSFGIATSGVSNANRIANSVVSLPINPYLTDNDVTRIIDACNSWTP